MNPHLRGVGQVLLQGAKQIGTRAAAHAVKSVFKDGGRIVKTVEKKVNAAIDRLEEMTADAASDNIDDEDTRG